jgi:hypothetical protein
VPREAKYQLFISYSRDDEVLLRELEKHLALLRREGTIRVWNDREIGAGEGWRGQIDKELENAHLILLLVSSSFIASDYCFDVEATRALERHRLGVARVVPVIVRPCDWQTAPFAELQALPTGAKPITRWKDRDEAWTEVAQGLRKAIAELRGHALPLHSMVEEGSESSTGGRAIERPLPSKLPLSVLLPAGTYARLPIGRHKDQRIFVLTCAESLTIGRCFTHQLRPTAHKRLLSAGANSIDWVIAGMTVN